MLLLFGLCFAVNAVNEEGNSALHLAYALNYKELGEYLKSVSNLVHTSLCLCLCLCLSMYIHAYDALAELVLGLCAT